jgi:hypothetical protein
MAKAHEIVNSIGVIFSIMLGATSLYLQLRPKDEKLVVDPGDLLLVNDPMKPITTAPLPLGNRTLLGPFYWKVMVNNLSDRAVSLKGVESRINDSRWGTYMVTGAFEGAYRDDLHTPALPMSSLDSIPLV